MRGIYASILGGFVAGLMMMWPKAAAAVVVVILSLSGAVAWLSVIAAWRRRQLTNLENSNE